MKRTVQYQIQEEFIRDVLASEYVNGEDVWTEFVLLAAEADLPAPLAVLRYLLHHQKLPHRLRDRVHRPGRSD